MKFKIGKKKWVVIFTKLKGATGWCYRSCRIIVISDKLKGRDLKYVAIHETLHALDWSKSEKKVERAASAILEVLDAL